MPFRLGKDWQKAAMVHTRRRELPALPGFSSGGVSALEAQRLFRARGWLTHLARVLLSGAVRGCQIQLLVRLFDQVSRTGLCPELSRDPSGDDALLMNIGIAQANRAAQCKAAVLRQSSIDPRPVVEQTVAPASR